MYILSKRLIFQYGKREKDEWLRDGGKTLVTKRWSPFSGKTESTTAQLVNGVLESWTIRLLRFAQLSARPISRQGKNVDDDERERRSTGWSAGAAHRWTCGGLQFISFISSEHFYIVWDCCVERVNGISRPNDSTSILFFSSTSRIPTRVPPLPRQKKGRCYLPHLLSRKRNHHTDREIIIFLLNSKKKK